MKFYLALFVTLVAFGIPAVATYYPLQTYAVMSLFESANVQAAAAVMAVPPAASATSTMMDIPESERSIFPPRPI